jgi:pectate lyase
MRMNRVMTIVPILVGCVGLAVQATAQEPAPSAKADPDFGLIGWATMEGGTTGGKDGKTSTVTTVDEFRAAAGETKPLNILVSGTLDLGDETVQIAADKTVTGLDKNAGFVGHVYLHGAKNIILRNLTFANPKGAGRGIGRGDGLTAHSTHHVWVDHCNFTDCADGQFDITHGSDLFTVSWCRFSYTDATNGHRLSMLIGNRDDLGEEDAGKLRVTLHHNWVGDLVSDRAPRVRFGQVHVFNNYYGAKDISTCVGLGYGSQVLVESSNFDGVKYPWKGRSAPEGKEGRVHWNDDNVFNHPKLQVLFQKSDVFKPPYAYKLDPGKDVKDIVMKYSGEGNGPFDKK